MPIITRDYGRLSLMLSIRTRFEFLDRAVENLTLHLHAFTVARVEMFGQTARLFTILGIEQLDNGTGCVHTSGRVDSRSDAEAKVVGIHFCALATARDVDQRAQTIVHGLW